MVMAENENLSAKVPAEGSLHLKVSALLQPQQIKLHRKKLNQLILKLSKMDRT